MKNWERFQGSHGLCKGLSEGTDKDREKLLSL